MILGNLIIYKNKMIYFKTKLVKLELERKHIVMLFNMLLLGKNKAVLGKPFLQKYNLKINWTIRDVKLQDINNHKIQQQTKLVWYQVGAMYKETQKQIDYIPKRYYKYKKLWDKQFGKKLAKHVL